MNFFRVILIVFLSVILAGCASSRSGKVYSRDQARSPQTVEWGVVTVVDQVQIEGTQSKIGALAGGATGAALGSTIGQGSGKTVAVVVGAVVGGLAGAAAEEKLTRKAALEITVDLDSGRTIVVVQEADEMFQPGERVRILESYDGVTRVRH